jgi:hypothetical protein
MGLLKKQVPPFPILTRVGVDLMRDLLLRAVLSRDRQVFVLVSSSEWENIVHRVPGVILSAMVFVASA